MHFKCDKRRKPLTKNKTLQFWISCVKTTCIAETWQYLLFLMRKMLLWFTIEYCQKERPGMYVQKALKFSKNLVCINSEKYKLCIVCEWSSDIKTYLWSCAGWRVSGTLPLLPQYVFMAWCLIKHGCLHDMVLSYVQGQLHLHLHDHMHSTHNLVLSLNTNEQIDWIHYLHNTAPTPPPGVKRERKLLCNRHSH